MKKVLIKIASVMVGLTLIIFFQEFIRNLFNTDPRIWFFPQFFGCLILVLLVISVFRTEIKFMEQCIKDGGWSNFCRLVLEKALGSNIFTKIFTSIKNFFKRIFNIKAVSIILKTIEIVLFWFVIICIWYHLFFDEDVYSRPIIVIVFIMSFVLLFLIRLFKNDIN